MALDHCQALLFVPVGAERHLASAIRHQPDAIILDLEDSIAPGAKHAARQRIKQDIELVRSAGIECVVRVNAPLRQMIADFDSVDLAHVAAFLLPKVESERQIENAAELTEGKAKLVALIETPLGVRNVDRIASVGNLAGLMLGSEDLSASLGVDPNAGVLVHVAAQIGVNAAAFGLIAIGFPGSLANFKDLDLYRSQITQGRNLGMNAVAAIHPAQLPVIRDCLKSSEADVNWAEKVLAAASSMQASGTGVIAIDGQMIDAPVIRRAERILKFA